MINALISDRLLSQIGSSRNSACAVVTLSLALLAGCGVTTTSPSAAPSSLGLSGQVHGGQQPVVGSKVYLYAASNTVGGASTSLLHGAGFVVSDAGGNFSITGDYTCPTGAYVYLLALGGNPGLPSVYNNELALAAGLGSCSALTTSQSFEVNEVTTVALAYVLSTSATSDLQVGGAPQPGNTNSVALGLATLPAFTDPASGVALATTPGGVVLPQAKLNALANSLAACVNSSGIGPPCSTLMTDAGVTTSGGTPMASGPAATPTDTFQAALQIAQNPSTVNTAGIYSLGPANAAFQPSATSAPSDWTLTVPGYPQPDYSEPTFFAGQTVVSPATDSSPAVYDVLLNGSQDFGDYSFSSDPNYVYTYGLGYEYATDANDTNSGVYFYDISSTHTWYTSPVLYPYLYDFQFGSYLYYYQNSQPREFYNFATDSYVVF